MLRAGGGGGGPNIATASAGNDRRKLRKSNMPPTVGEREGERRCTHERRVLLLWVKMCTGTEKEKTRVAEDNEAHSKCTYTGLVGKNEGKCEREYMHERRVVIHERQ